MKLKKEKKRRKEEKGEKEGDDAIFRVLSVRMMAVTTIENLFE